MKNMSVYILTNERRTVLYIGVTNDLERRLQQHREGVVAFTRQYNVSTLIYDEWCFEPEAAIRREKQLKGWTRAKKEALIATVNPDWHDLGADECKNLRGPSTALRPSFHLRSAQDDPEMGETTKQMGETNKTRDGGRQ